MSFLDAGGWTEAALINLWLINLQKGGSHAMAIHRAWKQSRAAGRGGAEVCGSELRAHCMPRQRGPRAEEERSARRGRAKGGQELKPHVPGPGLRSQENRRISAPSVVNNVFLLTARRS